MPTSLTPAFGCTEPLDRERLASAPLRSYPRPSLLPRPLTVKPAKAAQAAQALGLETLGDLLEHLPFRQEDRRAVCSVAELVPGEDASVLVEVRSIRKRPTRKRGLTLVEARVGDETGPLKVVWFNQPWLVDRLPAGTRVVLHGRYEGKSSFRASEHEIALNGTGDLHSTGLVPVYPATEGIASLKLRELVWGVRGLERHVVEPLPGRLRAAERMPERAAALAALHYPDAEPDAPAARERLAFEELLLLELALARRKRARRDRLRATPLPATGELVDPWLASLPFELTADQRAAVERVDEDIALERPMTRLLMGEVGAGKTVVALYAMLRALENGRQAALMAPTETLAEQHLATLDRLLGGHVPIALLTGSTPAARRRELLARLGSGELGLVVGTHALLEPGVEFADLALCVVDEQHRFGVRQRAALDAKARRGAGPGSRGVAAPARGASDAETPRGFAPHALHLTATPIPRTLALTAYGDLDVTTLRELPAGRPAVETHVVDGARARARAYERAREEIAQGRQCFVVCPLVEESDTLQAKAATLEAERLARTEFREQRVELIHGQMPAKAKSAAMAAFTAGDADVLVATSVVEVGIDVPNAAVMLIEAAERYGLSQLHQLRGRIGRSEHPSVCILFGDPQLPRLKAIAEEHDGFRLAEVDLRLRGAGEVLGTRQHGLPEFRVARIPEDAELLERARRRADELLAADPALGAPEHVLLRDASAARFGSDLEPIPA